jgi:hypothetical protein
MIQCEQRISYPTDSANITCHREKMQFLYEFVSRQFMQKFSRLANSSASDNQTMLVTASSGYCS